MSEDMELADYLAKGGKLTSPANVPARYRAELMRLMASFVDSELAGAAGFADRINEAPGLAQRAAAARIVAEKFENAARVLAVMGDFGADTQRYAAQHPWAARLPRDADIGQSRQGGDMRLSVFHYPIADWTDSVVMNVLMGKASLLQIEELARCSYQPLAEAMREILAVETRHVASGIAALRALAGLPEQHAAIQTAFAYWHPRVAATFGAARSSRFDSLNRFGLRHVPNDTLAALWQQQVADLFTELGTA
ncbi:phenylacetic acid catabolic [Microvirga tunisiensis]|uniref:Phenylacetic acid catabolic n=2 Tax=Pannonibacter tanglangensis TaxID=2750084 RepID=A0A7X5J8X8_9HYPH|nr:MULTISPECIES: Phenylacetic acid catabolic protein [unclassified Pannonibacter]NBN62289.1 phenylacetic acid catabolic [Pannonibacter sp. XCT-34]NBN77956.1 phenylacetic acid catabolic [Pannonibacter sp. XCT-53]